MTWRKTEAQCEDEIAWDTWCHFGLPKKSLHLVTVSQPERFLRGFAHIYLLASVCYYHDKMCLFTSEGFYSWGSLCVAFFLLRIIKKIQKTGIQESLFSCYLAAFNFMFWFPVSSALQMSIDTLILPSGGRTLNGF